MDRAKCESDDEKVINKLLMRTRWRFMQHLGITLMRAQAHMIFNCAIAKSQSQYNTALPGGVRRAGHRRAPPARRSSAPARVRATASRPRGAGRASRRVIYCKKGKPKKGGTPSVGTRRTPSNRLACLVMQRLRGAVLRHVRLQPSQALLREAPPALWAAARSFAAGTYLDKAQVTDRVVSVVKNFSKVDPAKARARRRAPQLRAPGARRARGRSRVATLVQSTFRPVPTPSRRSPPAAQVQPTSTFQAELGLDSLDTVEVVMAFEEEFSIEIPDSEADKILSVADAIEYVAAHPQAK
jgi:NADH dehydrogenase (ubiquinone) 1 alpha/beta subcomplex 1